MLDLTITCWQSGKNASLTLGSGLNKISHSSSTGGTSNMVLQLLC